MDKQRHEFMELAGEIVAQLKAGPLGPDAERDKVVVLAEIRLMMQAVEGNSLPPKARRPPTLGYMIADQWPPGDDLGNAIAELEARYRKLA